MTSEVLHSCKKKKNVHFYLSASGYFVNTHWIIMSSYMFSFSVEPVSEVLCTVGHVNSIDPFDQSVAKYYNGWTKNIL